MSEFIEKWKRGATATKSKKSGRSEKTSADNDRRDSTTILLIRRGSILRAGIALGSKGLGDLTIPAIFSQMQAQHPPRMHEIDQDVFDLIPEDELQFWVDIILPKLDLNSALSPT